MSDTSRQKELDEALRTSLPGNAFKRLIDQLTRRADVFAGDDGKIYASLDVDQKHIVTDVEGQEFQDYLYLLADELGLGASRPAMIGLVPLLRARARRGKTTQPVFIRSGYADGVIYFDRVSRTRSIVAISKDGVQVVETCPVHFTRMPDMKELPEPNLKGSLNEIRDLLPQLDDINFRKLEAAMLIAANPNGPYPITVVEGEQDTGKTTALRLARAVFDPRGNERALRTLATSGGDLWVQAHNERFLFFDNVTCIPPRLEDELCQISTGGAYSGRKYYTNDQQVVLSGRRPIFMTSIGIPTRRSDLLSRMLTISVSPIPLGGRRSERDIEAQFVRLYSRIFGGFCKALSACLRRIRATSVSQSVRMQDALEWVSGAEQELGWPSGTFGKLYAQDQSELAAGVLEEDPLAAAIIKLVQVSGPFRGTATQLLDHLENHRSPSLGWPGRNEVRNRLLRLAPLLKLRGVAIELQRTSDRRRDRIIIIRRILRIPPRPSPA